MQWTSAPNIGEAPLPQRARGYWKARISAAGEGLEKLLEAERTQLPPWIVVGFGAGIAAWFALDDPRQWLAFLSLGAGVAIAGFALGRGRTARAVGWFALVASLGCGLVWARSMLVQQPRLQRPTVAQLTGTVQSVDHLAARGATRVLLRSATVGLPPNIRLSIDDDKLPAIAPGAMLEVRARLVAPPPMALPGTYDFARDAWFRGLGAVGKPLGPIVVVRPGEAHGLDRVHDSLRTHIESRLSNGAAGMAVALATGDQNAVGKDDAEAMRPPFLLRDRAGDYVRSLVAEASGFEGDPAALDSRPYSACSKDSCVALLRKGNAQWRLLATRSSMRIDWKPLTAECAGADIVVSSRRLPRGCTPRWLKLDSPTLRRTGGVALYLGTVPPHIDTVANRVGNHPWAQVER